MNYSWRIECWMEGGAHVIGKYVGPERNTGDVSNRVLVGPNNEFFGMYGVDEKHNLLFKRGSVVACDISEWR